MAHEEVIGRRPAGQTDRSSHRRLGFCCSVHAPMVRHKIRTPRRSEKQTKPAIYLQSLMLAGIAKSGGVQWLAAEVDTHETKYVQSRGTIAPAIVCTGINRRLEQVRSERRNEIRQSVPCTMPVCIS